MRENRGTAHYVRSRELTEREQWVDAAKGLTIVLVVLHHLLWPMLDAGLDVSSWIAIDTLLSYARMPAFFLLSGLFAGRVIMSRSGTRLWCDRVLKFLYLFILWSVLRLGLFVLIALVEGHEVGELVLEKLGSLVRGTSPTWFLAALAVFFTIARLTRFVPPVIQVAIAAVGSVVVLATAPEVLWAKMWLFVFFLVGCHYGLTVRRVVNRVGAARIGGGRLGRGLGWIGARTLPVYLLHVPVLVALLALPSVVTTLDLLGVAAPLALTTVVTVLSLIVYLLTRRIPGLFAPPWRQAPSVPQR